MGCRKLTYYEAGEGIEKSPLKILGAPEEKIPSLIFCNNYTPFGGSFNSYTSGTENLYKFTGKEEQKETQLVDFGARMYDPWLARWNSMDPLARNYFEWSPYHYAYNNPMKYIDPDGREIWINTGFRKLKYEDGKLTTKKGKDVTHKVYKKDGKTFKKSFLGKTAGALNFMSENGMSDMVDKLEGSDFVFNIQQTSGGSQFMPDDVKNAGYNQNMDTENTHPHQQGKYYFGEASTERGSGGTLHFNSNASVSIFTQNGEVDENNPTAHFAHEFTHAFDSNNGDLDFRLIFGGVGVGVGRKEARAMYYGNNIRIKQGKGYLRIKYDESQPARVVKDGKPIPVNPPKRIN